MPKRISRRRNRGHRKDLSVRSLNARFTSSNSSNTVFPSILRLAATLTSSAGGQITYTLLMNPNGSTDWAGMSGLYDEFRVLGVRVDLVSLQQFSVTANNALGVVVFDNDDATALASIGAATSYGTAKFTPAIFTHEAPIGTNQNPCFTYEWIRPSSGPNTAISWVDVGAPNNSLGSVKFYFTGLSVTTQYLGMVVTWFCEFRGRR
jgi:hypothetical protein